jgi:hypothetical protein
VKECGPKPAGVGKEDVEWNALESLFMNIVRDAFHAFSLGDDKLAGRARDGEAAFEKWIAMLRSRLLKKASRNDSSLLDFVTVEGRLARAALDMVRGDVNI